VGWGLSSKSAAPPPSLPPLSPSLSLGASHCWQLLRNLALYNSTNFGALQCWQLLRNLSLTVEAAAGVSSNVLLSGYHPDGPCGVVSRPRRLRRFFFGCGFSVAGGETDVDAFAGVGRSPSALSISLSAGAATRSVCDEASKHDLELSGRRNSCRFLSMATCSRRRRRLRQLHQRMTRMAGGRPGSVGGQPARRRTMVRDRWFRHRHAATHESLVGGEGGW